MTARDEKILTHVGLYRLSFRAVLSDMYFDGRTPANVLGRLMQQGRIRARSGLPERLSYYQLTPAEARRRGLPEARARPLGGQALQTHIGVLWFCWRSPDAYRRRLDRQELRKHLDLECDNAPHCIQGGEEPVVWRIHVTGQRSNDATLVKHLVARLDGCPENSTIGSWIAAGRYAIAILAESEGRRLRLKEMIRRHGLKTRTRTTVEYAPSPQSLALAFREQQL
jgi:hypothetical protein